LYGAARIGDLVVNSKYSPTVSGWAIILLSGAVLSLGGCGRKGPLDLPPHGTAAQPVAAEPTDTERDAAAKPTVFNPTYGADAGPVASKGTKKSFVLDPLLNSN
jgi:predicted small lipoprotein YifL